MFKARSKAVIYELLDDEIILADLDVGIYCSIRESGIPAWQLFVSGHSIEEAFRLFQEKYPADSLQTIHSFLNRLLEERLLVPTGVQPKPAVVHLFWPSKFHPPIFEK